VKRVRWFGADWPVGLRTLASKMRAHSFQSQSAEGFLVERVRDDTITGRYIEKLAVQETIVDPFGEPTVFERTVYNQLEFNLTSKFPHIEFYDAPRNTQSFMSKLAEYNNFALTIAPLAVNIMDWADSLQRAARSRATVSTLQVSGLEVDKGVTAKLLLSGDKDVREALRSIAKNKKYDLDRLHVRLFQDGLPVTVQLSRSGSAKLEATHLEEFVPLLRESLPRP
jgi:hypothetical protein